MRAFVTVREVVQVELKLTMTLEEARELHRAIPDVRPDYDDIAQHMLAEVRSALTLSDLTDDVP